MFRLQRRHHGLAATAGQVHVEQHDLGQDRADRGDRRHHIVGLAHDLHVVTEFGPHPGPEQPVVIHDEHPRPGAAHAWLASVTLRGMVRDTSVPSPGALRMAALPPRRDILARTDSASPLRSAGTVPGSNPLPRSRTNTETSAGSTSAKIEMTLAPDHFAALTVASRAAAIIAVRSSFSGQSPTRTTSTATPCCASTSCWISRTPPASVMAWSSMDPGGLPSNSQERSS